MVSSSRTRFYEAYWQRKEGTVPGNDPTTEDRKHLLASALRQVLVLGNRPGKVLDAGCGDGEFSAFIRELGFEVIGIDIASAAIERARKVYPEICFYVGSLEDKLPFINSEFDVIWSTEVLEHLFDVYACLSEFNRVLSEGGC